MMEFFSTTEPFPTQALLIYLRPLWGYFQPLLLPLFLTHYLLCPIVYPDFDFLPQQSWLGNKDDQKAILVLFPIDFTALPCLLPSLCGLHLTLMIHNMPHLPPAFCLIHFVSLTDYTPKENEVDVASQGKDLVSFFRARHGAPSSCRNYSSKQEALGRLSAGRLVITDNLPAFTCHR